MLLNYDGHQKKNRTSNCYSKDNFTIACSYFNKNNYVSDTLSCSSIYIIIHNSNNFTIWFTCSCYDVYIKEYFFQQLCTDIFTILSWKLDKCTCNPRMCIQRILVHIIFNKNFQAKRKARHFAFKNLYYRIKGKRSTCKVTVQCALFSFFVISK